MNNKEDLENARVEYSATNEAYLHYDNYTWQVGAILIAGSFAYWGFLLQCNSSLLVISIGNLLVSGLMSIWLLYSSHNRQIYLFKLHRIHELEKQLGMLQHLRFRKDFKNGYRVSSKGYYLDGLIYIFVSFGSQVITLNTAYKDSWNTENIIFFSAVPVLVIYIMIKVKIAERNAKHLILKLERSVGTG